MAIVPNRENRNTAPARMDQMPASPAGTHVPRGFARRGVGAIVTTLIGIAFFNLVIGVFGLSAAIVSLVLFIALAAMIFHCPQAGETSP